MDRKGYHRKKDSKGTTKWLLIYLTNDLRRYVHVKTI